MQRRETTSEIEATRPEETRLLDALEMWEFGVELTALRLRRDDPEASDAEIGEKLRAWLRERPADAPGRAVSWPRE